MTEFTTVHFEVSASHVATITLNRPEVLNAFNQTMLEEFAQIWQRCRSDDAVHAVVLRANGERAFSTGVDRKEGRDRHPNPFSEDDPGLVLGAKQNRVWKPLVCALHGMVAGGAFYWVNEADVIICADDTTFFDPHTTYGMASALEPAALLRRMPLGEVLRIALFGLDERMSASRALQVGLVSEVVPRASLFERADALATRLAQKPPLAVQATVKAIWDSLSMSPEAARHVPLLYPQLANPQSQVDFNGAERPAFEVR
jgi:enoyl-CoA hydratase/carnithine racemase